MACGPHSLPDEVLVHIFSFLEPRNKVNASSTCKHWMSVMNNCPKLFYNVRVYFKKLNNKYAKDLPLFDDDDSKYGNFLKYHHNALDPYDIFTNMTRNFCYFHFKSINFDKNWICFLQKLAPQSYRLTLEKCCIDPIDFGTILNCPNLQVLEMWGCNACEIFSYLPKLKWLHFNRETILTDKTMMHLENIIPPSLTVLGISLRIVCDSKVIKRFYANETMFETNPVETFLSHLAMESFIRKRCSMLEVLDVSGSNITDKAMISISKFEGLRLKHLNVAACFNLGKMLPTFCINQPAITILNLRGVLNFDDPSMEVICTALPQLEELILTYCGMLNRSVVKVFQLKCLRRLDLTACLKITADSLSKAVEGLACFNLKKLSLCSTKINDQILTRILPLVPDLRELSLCSCHITDFSVSHISRGLTSLTHLNLSLCSKVTDNGLLGFLEGSESAVPISNIEGLQKLELRECNLLSEEGMVRAIQFKRLVSLDLTGCLSLTEAGVKFLTYYNPELRYFQNGVVV